MKKLLVPVDNSPNALRALDYAISLARGEHSPIELHIVTAHESAFDNPRALAYRRERGLDVEFVVSHEFPSLDRFLEGMDLFDRHEALKVVFYPDGKGTW